MCNYPKINKNVKNKINKGKTKSLCGRRYPDPWLTRAPIIVSLESEEGFVYRWRIASGNRCGILNSPDGPRMTRYDAGGGVAIEVERGRCDTSRGAIGMERGGGRPRNRRNWGGTRGA